MDNQVVTFDFILDCWKTKKYPADFESLLTNYLDFKAEFFGTANVHEPGRWLNKILISVEIGISINEPKFKEYRKYWERLLGRKWAVSIEDEWIRWD